MGPAARGTRSRSRPREGSRPQPAVRSRECRSFSAPGEDRGEFLKPHLSLPHSVPLDARNERFPTWPRPPFGAGKLRHSTPPLPTSTHLGRVHARRHRAVGTAEPRLGAEGPCGLSQPLPGSHRGGGGAPPSPASPLSSRRDAGSSPSAGTDPPHHKPTPTRDTGSPAPAIAGQ